MSDHDPAEPIFHTPRAEEIDECVRAIFRDHIKPALKPVYAAILGDVPKPDPKDFLPGDLK